MNPEMTVSDFTEEDLQEVLEVVFMTVLELPVERANSSEFESDDYLVCGISISGEWNGSVHVRAGLDFLNYAASQMFNIELGQVVAMDRIDTLTELNNMLGGTVKCLLPEPSDLSLPQIILIEQANDLSLDWFYFLCGNMPLAVAVTQMASDAEKAA